MSQHVHTDINVSKHRLVGLGVFVWLTRLPFQTVPIQHLGEVHFLRCLQVLDQPIGVGGTGYLFDDSAEVLIGVARLTMRFPQQSHHVIERLGSIGLGTDLHIEQRSDQRTLQVITDPAVVGIFVRPIVFDPSIETAFGQGLPQTPRCTLNGRYIFAKFFQIVLRLAKTAPSDE